MKAYQYATVAIAGIVTIAGTAAIARTELRIVRAGQAVASILMPGNHASITIEHSSVASYDARDLGSQLTSDVKSGKMPDVRQTESSLAPLVEVHRTPLAHERATERRMMRLAPEKSALPKPAEVTLKGDMLATRFTYHALPAAPNAKGFKFTIHTGGGKPFLALAGLPGTCSKDGDVQLKFDEKTFAKEQKALAEQLKQIRVDAWTSMSKDDLKKLGDYQWKLKNTAAGRVITIDPQATIDAAEKTGDAASDQADSAFDAAHN